MEKFLKSLIEILEKMKKSIVQKRLLNQKIEQEKKKQELDNIASIVTEVVESESNKLFKKLSQKNDSMLDGLSVIKTTKKEVYKTLKKKNKKKNKKDKK